MLCPVALSPWSAVSFVKVAVKVVVKVDNWHTVAVLHGFGRGSDNTVVFQAWCLCCLVFFPV